MRRGRPSTAYVTSRQHESPCVSHHVCTGAGGGGAAGGWSAVVHSPSISHSMYAENCCAGIARMQPAVPSPRSWHSATTGGPRSASVRLQSDVENRFHAASNQLPPVCAASGIPGHAPAFHAGPTFSSTLYVTHSSPAAHGYGNAVLCGVVHFASVGSGTDARAACSRNCAALCWST